MLKNHKMTGKPGFFSMAVLMMASVLAFAGCSRSAPSSTPSPSPIAKSLPKAAVSEKRPATKEPVLRSFHSKLLETPPKVLIISLEDAEEPAPGDPLIGEMKAPLRGIPSHFVPGIRQLLEQHKIPATVVSPEAATLRLIYESDLVLIAGNGRSVAELPKITRPVLGFGCCGCAYFGTLHLKNGQPYT
jgi:hypothetical protein